jgi:hypothetical protein
LVAFGRYAVAWADRWFAYNFSDASRLITPHRSPMARLQREWRELGKAALAWAVSVAILVVISRQLQPKWAPWWIYLVVILGANYLRQAPCPRTRA